MGKYISLVIFLYFTMNHGILSGNSFNTPHTKISNNNIRNNFTDHASNITRSFILNDTSVPINCSSHQKSDIDNCEELTSKLNAITLNASIERNNTAKKNNTQNEILGKRKNSSSTNHTSVSLKPSVKSLVRKNHDDAKNAKNISNTKQNKTLPTTILKPIAVGKLKNKTSQLNLTRTDNFIHNNSRNASKLSHEHSLSNHSDALRALSPDATDSVHVLSANETTKEAVILKHFFQNNKIQMSERKFEIPKFNFTDMASTLVGKNSTLNSMFNNTVKNISSFIDNFNMSNPVGNLSSTFLNKSEEKSNNTESKTDNTDSKSDSKSSGSGSSNESGISVGTKLKNLMGNASTELKNLTNLVKQAFVNKFNSSAENKTTYADQQTLISNNTANADTAVVNGTNRDQLFNNENTNDNNNLNHTHVMSFSGEITKLQTGTNGDTKSNGTKFMENVNMTNDFSKRNETFKLTNLTSTKNCTGCMKDSNASMFQINNDSLDIKVNENGDNKTVTTKGLKKCNIDNIKNQPVLDMVMRDEDYDVAGANINCVMKLNPQVKRKTLTELYKRRLISNHIPLHTKTNNVTNAKNTKVDEAIEKEKNNERQQSNEERAHSNEQSSKELEKLKYKILNGIHDSPDEPVYTPDERSNPNKTIPIDPSMLPEQYSEPITEDNKDALVGIMGIDTSPAIEPTNTTNSTNHKLPDNRSKNPTGDKIEHLDVKKEDKSKKLVDLNANNKENSKDESHVVQPPVKLKNNTKLIGGNTTQNISIELPRGGNDTDESRVPMKKSILCFGDSLTKGYYDNGTSFHPYSEKLKELLENFDKNTEYDINVEAVTGMCVFTAMRKRLPVILNETYPIDLVIILGGTNDLLHHDCNKDIDLFENIKALHEMCHKRGIKTVAVTIPEMIISKNGTDKMSRKVFNEAWGTVNQKLRVWAYSNNHPKMVILSDLADEFTRQNLRENLSEFWDDDVHPNAKGYDKIGEIIYKDIKGKI